MARDDALVAPGPAVFRIQLRGVTLYYPVHGGRQPYAIDDRGGVQLIACNVLPLAAKTAAQGPDRFRRLGTERVVWARTHREARQMARRPAA